MTTETLPATSPETVTPLKPSEALRLGRLTRPVRLTDGGFLRDDNAACALGAMSVGFGLVGSDPRWRTLLQDIPWKCPLRCRMPYGLTGIAHLNDDHHWSDDQIVAWLEGLGL